MIVGVKDHAFSLPPFTRELDELFPEENSVLLPQTSAQSLPRPILSPTSGSFLWKSSYKSIHGVPTVCLNSLKNKSTELVANFLHGHVGLCSRNHVNFVEMYAFAI